MMTTNDIADLITQVESGDYSIDSALADIAKASRGELVRAAIYAALLNCYNDGKAGSGVDLLARAKLEALDSGKASVTDFSVLSKQVRSLMNASHVIRTGMTDVVTVEAGSYVDISVTFGHTYTSPPRVVASISGGSTSVNYGLLTLTIPNGSITTTGCTLRLFNRHTALFQPRVIWAAIGDTAEDAADLLATVIDSELSSTSQNAVSNAAVTEAIYTLKNAQQCGTTASVSCEAGAYTDVQVLFTVPFPDAPVVTFSAITSSTNVDGVVKCESVILNNSISASGFTIRVYNNGASAITLKFSWAAMYTPS